MTEDEIKRRLEDMHTKIANALTPFLLKDDLLAVEVFALVNVGEDARCIRLLANPSEQAVFVETLRDYEKGHVTGTAKIANRYELRVPGRKN